MSLKISPQLIGMGDNRRGPQTPPVPYPPNPGDGDNVRGATKPEGMPAGMYGPVPPISWVDSGIPGIFQRSANVMWEVKPPRPNEIGLTLRVVQKEGSMNKAVAEVASKLRFAQKKIFEDLVISGPTPLDMTNFTSPKVVYIRCDKGEGTVKFDSDLPHALVSEGDTSKTTLAFFNYSGVPRSITFDGSCVVDVLLFQ